MPSKMRLLMAFRSRFVYSTRRGPIYRALCQFMLVSYTHMYDSGKRDEIYTCEVYMFLRKEARISRFQNFFWFSLFLFGEDTVKSLQNLSLNVSNVIFICPIFLLSYLYVEVALAMSEYAGCLTDLDELR